MDIAQTITQRAKERGIDPELALSIAKAESNLRPNAKNPKSSAHGLFQIIDDTWKQYGGDPKKRNDVNENIRVGLEIIADNQRDLKTTFGRAPRPAEVYAAHFFGKEGAKKVIGADPDAPVSTVVSERVLNANPELLKGKTVFQALDALGRKVGDSSSGQAVRRAPNSKTARPAYKEDPSKPPVISDATQTLQRFGPGYQAALALTYLSDTQEESDDPDAPSIVEREAQAEIEEQTAQVPAPTGPRAADMLASMDFGYAPVVTAAQPQQAPVRMNQGGEARAGSAKEELGTLKKLGIFLRDADISPTDLMAVLGKASTTASMALTPSSLNLGEEDELRRLRAMPATIDRPVQRREGSPETGEMTDPEAALFAGRGDVPFRRNETAEMMGAAREDRLYQDLEQYLQSRDAVPGIKVGRTEPYDGVFTSDNLNLGSGWITVDKNMRELERPSVLIHEATHAADRQMEQQAMEQGLFGNNQFTEAYEKLVGPEGQNRTKVARAIDPQWARVYGDYRAKPKEIAGFGVGAFAKNPSHEGSAPDHVDATAAQELMILLELAQRNVDKGPKGLSKIPAAFRKLGNYAEGGEVSDPEAALFAGRGDVPAKPNMTGRELAQQALYGVADLPYVVAGAPVDLAAMAMAPFGYKDPKPFMGSEDIKDRMTRAGIRPADTTDPRLMGPRSAAELLSSLTNPAGVTRSAVTAAQKGAQAVGTGVMQGAQRAEKALEPVVTSTMERGGKAAELLQALSPAPAQAMPGKVGAPAKPAAFTQLPSAEAPFVGRLDQFAAGMQSPMKKEQLLGTLKGKFKDYEIERARVALQDLPDDAKVMPTDFLNRLNEVHNPAGFRTTVLEPKAGSYYQTMDNVFVDGDKTPPMGVIHLTKFVDPSAAARFDEISRADSQLLTLSRGGNMWGSRLDTDAVEKWADSQPDGFHIKNLLNSAPVQQAKGFSENMFKAQDAADFLLFPGVGKAQIPDIPYPRNEQGYIDFVLHNRLRGEAAQQVRQQGKEMWKALGLPPDLLRDPPGLDPNMPFTNEGYKGAIMDAMREYRNQMRVKAQDAVYPVMDYLGRLRERIDAEAPYMGQHSSLQNAPMPIAFSRYTEREAVIPGMGKAKGIYVHELQSDLLDDVRKKGAKGGSQTKDYAELKRIDEKLGNYPEGLPDSEVYSLLGRRKVLEQRLDRSPYTPEANYSLDEAIPNMEQSPQVVQQLMVKNAVSAAIQRGDRFVAFPGKESAQAQLYEKLPRNLDAVVKDLGPGFEKRSIEMTLPNGEPAMFNAIVWAPEAAQKLQKSGIPFAKGGMVERNNHDNRSYK